MLADNRTDKYLKVDKHGAETCSSFAKGSSIWSVSSVFSVGLEPKIVSSCDISSSIYSISRLTRLLLGLKGAVSSVTGVEKCTTIFPVRLTSVCVGD